MVGISVYPYKEDINETINYIREAANVGIRKLFINMLALDDIDTTLEQLRQVIAAARAAEIYVSVDIAPSVFEALKIDKMNLAFFEALGVNAVRLDEGYDGFHEAMMTFKNRNLNVEINISYDNPYLATVLSYEPIKDHIIGCHNFYPQKYTGLSLEQFTRCTKRAKNLGVRTVAFIGEHKANLHGPHPYDHGLCTLEMHRELPLLVQAKHLLAMGNIDDIIVANAFVTIEELQQLVNLQRDLIEFRVQLKQDISLLEKELCLAKLHFNRGDVNDYVVRSTFVKLDIRDKAVDPHEMLDAFSRGMITLGNNNIGQYKGELNIVKQAIANIDNGKNYIGVIVDEEQFLIDYIKPWTKFIFREEQ